MSNDFDFGEFCEAMKYCGIPVYTIEDLMKPISEMTNVEIAAEIAKIVDQRDELRHRETALRVELIGRYKNQPLTDIDNDRAD